MTSVAQNGIFGFGPQPGKGTFAHEAAVPVLYRHRAANISLDGLDGAQIGPGEVGGLAVPTFPYKDGQIVTGGASLYPRLANYFGWLLQGALGGCTTTTPTKVFATATLGAAPIPAYVTGLASPAAPTQLMVVGTPAGATLTGNVVVTGTDEADAPQTETFALAGAKTITGTKVFKTVVSMDLPTRVTLNDKVDVYPLELFSHDMRFKSGSGNEVYVPWMSMYKYIPGDQSAAAPTDTDLYEQYRDCKITSMVFTLPNGGPIACRLEALGRYWRLSDTKPVKTATPIEWTNQMENYKSIPIGSNTSGYIKIPTFSADDLPVVGAQVTMANIPLRLQDEKIYGTNMLDDITIVSRALAVDLVVKWRDPTLCRLIRSGSVSATEWSEKPFVTGVDVLTAANDYIFGTTGCNLNIKSDAMFFQVNGGIDLVANQSVQMRLTGTALAPDADTDPYCQFILNNLTPGYVWPTS